MVQQRTGTEDEISCNSYMTLFQMADWNFSDHLLLWTISYGLSLGIEGDFPGSKTRYQVISLQKLFDDFR